MIDRGDLKTEFVRSAGWSTAKIVSMTGDASNRRYDRLYMGEKTAILMDAAPERGEDVRPFIKIAEHLRSQGFSAPEILAQDVETGFLLLEDLGDDRFKEVLDAAPAREIELYAAATDALVSLHTCRLPEELPVYGTKKMIAVCAPVFTSYCKSIAVPDFAHAQDAFNTALEHLLERHVVGPTVLVERDFHAENLLWLPERSGLARVGMLDFQDAAAGHPAYDLVSMLQDARRDVSQSVENAMIDRYVMMTGFERNRFLSAYWTLGFQRNMRIIGVFARLATELNKPHYVEFMPRVWAHVERALERPEFSEMREIVRAHIPSPTPDILGKLMS